MTHGANTILRHAAVWMVLGGSAWAAPASLCPGHSGNPRLTHGDATCDLAGGTTTVRLKADSRILWDNFSVAAGEEIRFQSVGARHGSVNVVDGFNLSNIDGKVIADGPFALINSTGIAVGRTGSISAPRVLLSALASDGDLSILSGGTSNFQPGGLGLVNIEGSVVATEGSLVVLGSSVTLSSTAELKGASGRIQVVAADTATVSGPDTAGNFGVSSTSGSGSINNEGRLEANQVRLISDGFLRNGGRIITRGAGNSVHLEGSYVVHENRPDSVIETDNLTTQGFAVIEGSVIKPQDGSNPSGVTAVRALPRTNGTSALVADVRPAQFSFSPLQTATTQPSVLPSGSGGDGQSLAVRRRGGEVTETEEARRKKVAAVGAKPLVLKKASFFGQTVKR